MGDASLAKHLGGDPAETCLVKAASNRAMPGFRTVARFARGGGDWNFPTRLADGVNLTERNQSAIIRPADCPVVWVHEAQQHRGFLLHCGRPALTPILTKEGQFTTFLMPMVEKLCQGVNGPQLSAVITGAICRDCFTHDCIDDDSEVGQFRQAFPTLNCVDETTGGLDLVQVIIDQLLKAGVCVAHIIHDGICTFGDTRLASYKRDKTKLRNSVVAVLH
jgi:copper oxidase (laccase) domain-containing protein